MIAAVALRGKNLAATLGGPTRVLTKMAFLCLFLLMLAATAVGAESTSVSVSSDYDIQGEIKVVGTSGDPQSSSAYEVTTLVDKANNGLAIGSGSKMTISWPSEAADSGMGYNVYSSSTGRNGVFEKLNTSLLTAPPYIREYKENGTYYYYVVHVVSEISAIQCTEVFAGVIKDINGASDWTLYN